MIKVHTITDWLPKYHVLAAWGKPGVLELIKMAMTPMYISFRDQALRSAQPVFA